jgi:hypothetical protein
MADAAVQPQDPNALVLAQRTDLEEALPRTEAGQRQRRALDVREARRLRGTEAATAVYSAAAPSRSKSVSAAL